MRELNSPVKVENTDKEVGSEKQSGGLSQPEHMGFGAGRPGFDSWPCLPPAMYPWASYQASYSLHLTIYKMGEMQSCEDEMRSTGSS